MNATLSAGSLISRTFSVWSRNAVTFSAVVLLIQIPALVLSLLAQQLPQETSAQRVMTVLAVFVTLFLRRVEAGSLTFGVLQAFNGKKATIGEIAAVGFRTLWPIFMVSLGMGVMVLVMGLMLIVPGVMAYCAYWVAIPAIVAEEDLEIDQALKRSETLTEGHRNSIFALVVVFFLINAGSTKVDQYFLSPILSVVMPDTLVFLLSLAFIEIIVGLGLTASAVAYHDLRVAKEGASTEQLVAVFE